MLTTEQFFAAASKAGMLKPLTWQPKSGAAAQTVEVKYRAPARDILQGGAFATEHSIEYPASILAGLVRGEEVTIAGVKYKLLEDPRSELDGSRLQAPLSVVG